MRWRSASATALFLVAACASTTSTPVLVPFADGDSWMLQRPLRYTIEATGQSIVVPAGFVTDFTSVPDALCALLPRSGLYLTAAVVHDFLYWDQTCTREQADRIFLHGMRVAAVPPLKKNALYAGARLAGARAWTNNEDEKRQGFIQVLPKERQTFSSVITWRNYRAQLRSEQAAEGRYARPSGAACQAIEKLD
jgi:hypothetical protein